MTPRLRGRTAQIEEPIEDAGKWAYELTMWDLAGETLIGEPWLFGPFETEEKAKEEGREIVRFASGAITGEERPAKYIDMKNGGILRPWDSN